MTPSQRPDADVPAGTDVPVRTDTPAATDTPVRTDTPTGTDVPAASGSSPSRATAGAAHETAGVAGLPLERPPCDLCGSDDVDVVWSGADWPSDVPPAVALARCRRCGLMFLRPRPAPEAIGRFYPPDYAPFRPAVEDERRAVMRRVRRRKLAERRRFVGRFHDSVVPGRVLDVGCGTGLFLREMALAGWDARGVELAPSAARYARRRFGLDVFEGMLEQAPLPAGAFDVVTFWDVLEHVYSPAATLALTARLLRPGGIAVIHVPNWDALDRRLFPRYWHGYDPPRHLYVFTRATLGALLVAAGLRPVAWRCVVPSYYAFILTVERWLTARHPRLARPVMRGLRFPGARYLFEPALWCADRLGRGSVIAVVARKPA